VIDAGSSILRILPRISPFHSVIDITYIVESEINAIEGSFHYCNGCEGSEEELEIEF